MIFVRNDLNFYLEEFGDTKRVLTRPNINIKNLGNSPFNVVHHTRFLLWASILFYKYHELSPYPKQKKSRHRNGTDNNIHDNFSQMC